MKSLAEYDYPELWETVQGIDSDGPSARRNLQDVIKGKCSRAETVEFLCDLYRDYSASTAGITSVPLLLAREAPDGYNASLTAYFAASILTHLPPESEIPPLLLPHVAREFRELGAKRMLESAVSAELDSIGILSFCETMLALKGQQELADSIASICDEELHRRLKASRLTTSSKFSFTGFTVSGNLTEGMK